MLKLTETVSPETIFSETMNTSSFVPLSPSAMFASPIERVRGLSFAPIRPVDLPKKKVVVDYTSIVSISIGSSYIGIVSQIEL